MNEDSGLPRDVPGSLELFIRPSSNEPDVVLNSESDESDIVSLSVKRIKLMINKKIGKSQQDKEKLIFLAPEWKKDQGTFSRWEETSNGADERARRIVEELKGLNPKEIFEKIVDNKIFEYIVQQTMFARKTTTSLH